MRSNLLPTWGHRIYIPRLKGKSLSASLGTCTKELVLKLIHQHVVSSIVSIHIVQ